MQLKDVDKLIELIDDDITLLNDDISSLDFVGMSREGYDVCLCTLQMVTQYIKALPTVEAEPVKHGRWINVKISISGNSSAECSLCGAVVHNNFSNVINYCPNCGAKMFDKDIDVHDKNVGKMDEVENDRRNI